MAGCLGSVNKNDGGQQRSKQNKNNKKPNIMSNATRREMGLDQDPALEDFDQNYEKNKVNY